MKRIRFVLHLIDSINDWVGKIVSFWILPTIAVIVWEVVFRYGLSAPTLWAFEVSAFIFCGFIILGGGYTLLHRAHVSTDIVYNRFPLRTRAIVDVITAILFFLFCGVLLKEGWRLAWEAVEMGRLSGSHWNPPIYPVMVVLPIGAFLLLLQGTAKFIRDLIMATTGEKP